MHANNSHLGWAWLMARLIISTEALEELWHVHCCDSELHGWPVVLWGMGQAAFSFGSCLSLLRALVKFRSFSPPSRLISLVRGKCQTGHRHLWIRVTPAKGRGHSCFDTLKDESGPGSMMALHCPSDSPSSLCLEFLVTRIPFWGVFCLQSI
jgi:hypothetical protein